MSSPIWEPLEHEEALRFGKLTLEVFYRDQKPARVVIVKREPSWGPEDVPKRTTHPLS